VLLGTLWSTRAPSGLGPCLKRNALQPLQTRLSTHHRHRGWPAVSNHPRRHPQEIRSGWSPAENLADLHAVGRSGTEIMCMQIRRGGNNRRVRLRPGGGCASFGRWRGALYRAGPLAAWRSSWWLPVVSSLFASRAAVHRPGKSSHLAFKSSCRSRAGWCWSELGGGVKNGHPHRRVRPALPAHTR